MLMKYVVFTAVLVSGLGLSAKEVLNDNQLISGVIPAIQKWERSKGILNLSKSYVTVGKSRSSKLKSLSKRFSGELKQFGIKSEKNSTLIRFVVGKLKCSSSPEAYKIEIARNVTITGNSPTGVFYGTRTLLQLLNQDKNTAKLPKGTISDYPRHQIRSLMLDVGRCPFPLPVLYDYLKVMSWYKMNELHLHLNDVAGDYYAFRVECKTFPGLTSKDLFYTKKELKQFQKVARSMGITVIPEFDMPGHATCFTKIWPELEYRGEKTWRGHHNHYLEIENPKVLVRIKKLLTEMIPIFDGPDIHIGTDEYRIGGWPNGKEFIERNDLVMNFANELNKHIRSKGKNTRMWYGTDHIKSKIKPDPTIILDIWNLHNTQQFAPFEAKNRFINSNEWASYIVPGINYYGVNKTLVYENWTPELFGLGNSKFQGVDINPENLKNNLLGGKLHVWMDAGPKKCSMQQIADLTIPSLKVYAEKLWGVKGSKTYAEFEKRSGQNMPSEFLEILK